MLWSKNLYKASMNFCLFSKLHFKIKWRKLFSIVFCWALIGCGGSAVVAEEAAAAPEAAPVEEAATVETEVEAAPEAAPVEEAAVEASQE